jgi:hypothetical protein
MSEIKVNTQFNTDMISVETYLDFGDQAEFHNLSRYVTNQVINLQEQAVREALIELGWTPPDGRGCP